MLANTCCLFRGHMVSSFSISSLTTDNDVLLPSNVAMNTYCIALIGTYLQVTFMGGSYLILMAYSQL